MKNESDHLFTVIFAIFAAFAIAGLHCKKQEPPTIIGTWQTLDEKVRTDYRITPDSLCASAILSGGMKFEACRPYAVCNDTITIFDNGKVSKFHFCFQDEMLIFTDAKKSITLVRK